MRTHPLLFPLRRVPAAALGFLILTASPSSAAEPAPPEGAGSAARTRTLNVADMDTNAQACTDFYQYAVGGWLEKNPIPSDRPRWGSFDELRQRTLDNLRGILERLAADKSAKQGSDEKKLGDFYGACMDEAEIEKLGIKGIAPELARIDDIKNLPALRAEILRLQQGGANVLFNFGSEEDRKDSSKVVAAALQGGLGLPDRDYYTKTDRSPWSCVRSTSRTSRKCSSSPARSPRRRRPTRRRSWGSRRSSPRPHRATSTDAIPTRRTTRRRWRSFRRRLQTSPGRPTSPTRTFLPTRR